MALPFYTVATVEAAKSLVIRHCRLMYDGRYVATDFGGELEDIDKLADQFDATYKQQHKRKRK